jgi:hypothetical protein
MKHDAEETYNIPENQRSEKSASIKVIGSLANLDHVIGLLANLCTIFAIIAAISSAPNTAKPIIYTVYMYLFNFISMPNFKLWASKHWSAHPFLHTYLFSIIETVWISFAKTAGAAPNQSLARTGDYARMNTIYIKVAVNYVKARIDELRTYMMMNVPVPEDKAPSITPAELNPKIQREIKLNALLNNSQSASRATSSKHRGQNSGVEGGENQFEGGENQSDTTIRGVLPQLLRLRIDPSWA